jgi:hypothetical protein
VVPLTVVPWLRFGPDVPATSAPEIVDGRYLIRRFNRVPYGVVAMRANNGRLRRHLGVPPNCRIIAIRNIKIQAGVEAQFVVVVMVANRAIRKS